MKNRSDTWRRFAIVFWLSLMLTRVPAYAQDTGVSAPHARGALDDDIPLLRATTRLVQVNAVVLDKGRPVIGLTEDDFEVFDNGVRQKIVHFSSSPNSAPTEPVKRSPLVVSNRQGMGGASGVTVILVDELILDAPLGGDLSIAAQIRRARLDVLSYLSTIKPGQQVALYALRQDGVVVLHDFTDDSAALADAAKSLGGAGPRGKFLNLDNRRFNGARTLNSWRQNAPVVRGTRQDRADNEVDEALPGWGFQAILEHLAGVPGRKNLVWISESLPRSATGFDLQTMLNARDANLDSERNPGDLPHHPDPRSHFNEIQSFARMLSNANIAVYPVDASGLTLNGAVSPMGSNTEFGTLSGSDPFQRAAADTIAAETGGQVVFDSNRLDSHLEEIVAQGESSYQIGYYPGDAAWDGKFHHIQLKVKPERKGFTLLARKGYYAADAPPPPNSEAPLREAAHSVVEAPGIGVTLNVSSNPLERGPQDVVVKLDIHGIQFGQSEDRFRARLDMAFVELGKDGRILGGVKDRLLLSLLPDTYSHAEMQGWFYPRKLWVDAEAEKLRVMVRDLATGIVGSISVPIHRGKRSLH